MPRADFRFAFKKRVRYAEVDAQGVVFNSRFLEYFDIGITEYWRAVGIYEKSGISGGAEFHVAKALAEFRAPLELDEEVMIFCRCSRIGTSSLSFAFELHGIAGEDLRAVGEEVHVHVAEVRGRPAPVPDWAVTLFETFENRSLRMKATP